MQLRISAVRPFRMDGDFGRGSKIGFTRRSGGAAGGAGARSSHRPATLAHHLPTRHMVGRRMYLTRLHLLTLHRCYLPAVW